MTSYDLVTSIRNGDVIAVRNLLSAGVDPDTGRKYSGRTADIPLHVASADGNCQLIRCLLRFNASIDIVDDAGSTPLFVAAWNGRLGATELLLSEGADVNVTNAKGMTPLHCASHWGRAEAVSLLLDYGAPIDSRDNEGMTALHWASLDGWINKVRILVDCGADIDVKDNGEETARDKAAKRRSKEGKERNQYDVIVDILDRTAGKKMRANALSAFQKRQERALFIKSATVPKARSSGVPSSSLAAAELFVKERVTKVLNSDTDCTVCMEKESDCALVRCGHVCMCYACALEINERNGGICPICRQKIEDVIKIFRA